MESLGTTSLPAFHSTVTTTAHPGDTQPCPIVISMLLICMDPSRPQRRNSGAHFCLVNLAVDFLLQRGLSLQALPSPFPLISCRFASLLGDAPLPIQDAQSTPSPLPPGMSCQQLSSGPSAQSKQLCIQRSRHFSADSSS